MKTGSGKGADPGFGTRLCCMFSAQRDARAVSPQKTYIASPHAADL